VDDQRFASSDVGEQAEELHRIDERFARSESAADAECDKRARARPAYISSRARNTGWIPAPGIDPLDCGWSQEFRTSSAFRKALLRSEGLGAFAEQE